jgi:hypothetical protein
VTTDTSHGNTGSTGSTPRIHSATPSETEIYLDEAVELTPTDWTKYLEGLPSVTFDIDFAASRRALSDLIINQAIDEVLRPKQSRP